MYQEEGITISGLMYFTESCAISSVYKSMYVFPVTLEKSIA